MAQYMILLVFYVGLSLSTGEVMDFGLKGYGMGLFLVLANLFVLSLVFALAWSRFKDERAIKLKIISEACQGLEDATTFTKGDFATTFFTMVQTSVPANHVLVFHYTTAKTARLSQRAGIQADENTGGVILSLRGPHHVTTSEAHVFKGAISADGVMFEAAIALAVPGRLLERVPGEDDPFVRMLPVAALLALWPSSYSSVVDPKPWMTIAKQHEENDWTKLKSEGPAILPPANILKSYLVHMATEQRELEKMKAKKKLRRQSSFKALLHEPNYDSDDSDGGGPSEEAKQTEVSNRLELGEFEKAGGNSMLRTFNPLTAAPVMKLIMKVSVYIHRINVSYF